MKKCLLFGLLITLSIFIFISCPTETQTACIVTYDGNGHTGGSVPTDSELYEEGATVTVMGNTGNLVKAGYTFVGWNTLADVSGTDYTESDTFVIGAINVTLYAKWTVTPVTGVTLNTSSTTIAAGSTEQLTVTVEPADASDNSVTWTSDNESTATVDFSGLVAAVAEGSATITVTTTDGGYTDTCAVTGYYPPGYSKTYSAGSISFDLHYVPGKTFKTGTDDNDGDATASSFWIGETEITYELWDTVYTWGTSHSYSFDNAGTLGSGGSGSDQEPVTTINWRDVMIWCNALTEYYNTAHDPDLECLYYYDSGYIEPLRDSVDDDSHSTELGGDYTNAVNPNAGGFDDPYVKADADGFRMITSDEWELAARYISDENGDGDIKDSGEYYPGYFACGADRTYWGDGSGDIDGDDDEDTNDEVAVYNDGVVTSTAEVKSKDDDKLGLYDMSGNVWEWCFDWSIDGSYRVRRGGSWFNDTSYLQVGFVGSFFFPYEEWFNFGFRLSRTP